MKKTKSDYAMKALSEEELELYRRQIIWQILEMFEESELLSEEEKNRIKVLMANSVIGCEKHGKSSDL